MKKILLLAACALFSATQLFAQEIENPDIVILSRTNLDTIASQATSLQTYVFNDACKGITMSMAGRAIRVMERQDFSIGLNFKLNDSYTINLPEGVKMYGIQFAGYSQGDNWDYLYAYGPTPAEWEWVDPIGTGEKDNNIIIEKAKYPMDPCETTFEGVKVFNKAGYTFASISFDNDPYEGTFSFNCSGNNQYTCLIRVFTSKTAWDNYSDKCKAIVYDGNTGIENVMIDRPAGDNVKYNLQGQRVNNPKGFYIMNGKVHYTAE